MNEKLISGTSDQLKSIMSLTKNDKRLLWAAKQGQNNLLSTLLELKEVDIEIENDGNSTPLIIAAEHKRSWCVRTLLEKGANIDHENHCGYKAIDYAIDNGDSNTLMQLLRAGAKPPGGFEKASYAVGKGMSSVCIIIKDPETKESRAMKVFKSMIKDEDIVHEAELCKLFNHSNIVKCYKYSVTDDRRYILMEHCSINLHDHLKHTHEPQSTLLRYFNQITSGVEHIHSLNFIHRDLKLGNIMLKEGQIKIIDFGLSIHTEEVERPKIVGTPNYIAPETLMWKECSFKSDVWALGVILYIMFFNVAPFKSKTKEAIFEKAISLNYLIPEKGPPEVRDAIGSMLVSEPADRPTVTELRDALFEPIEN